MSSASDSSLSSESVDSSDDYTDTENDMEVVNNGFFPYQDEPLADDIEENGGEAREEDADIDGLTPAILAARYRGEVPVNEWCECSLCSDANLDGALEFRCCREVGEAYGKLMFDGSIERIRCVSQHEDYLAHTNKSILLNVGPLLKDKNGRTYRRRADQSENEFLRAVAYRWVIRWMCGYMGWDKTRPLPACIYNHIRQTYSTHRALTGYATAEARE